ncbi:MAG: 5-dehydro-4-deoxy-D-glucuronate isomerase [Balneolales bacterium]|nr:5-dehydro-4-deoxy-D-glucuronate isomerase [Balneolales bacterium]
MITRNAVSPTETKNMGTQSLRANFLVEDLMLDGKISITYTHYDRLVIGGAVPTGKPLALDTNDAIKSDYFLERRELGIILVSGSGIVEVDGSEFALKTKECLYVGRGSKNVLFKQTGNEAARFFFTSAPAHAVYPTRKMTLEEAEPQHLGSIEKANERTIFKYIHPDGIESCQLVMGFTELKKGSIWNTMPPHTHDRRMEAYFYFDVPDEDRIWHFMGEPSETRHLVVANYEAIISPPWSIHSGAGTTNYSFIWAMAGENQSFADMDHVSLTDVK